MYQYFPKDDTYSFVHGWPGFCIVRYYENSYHYWTDQKTGMVFVHGPHMIWRLI